MLLGKSLSTLLLISPVLLLSGCGNSGSGGAGAPAPIQTVAPAGPAIPLNPVDFQKNQMSRCFAESKGTLLKGHLSTKAQWEKSFYWSGRRDQVFQLPGGILASNGLVYVNMKSGIKSQADSTASLVYNLNKKGVVTTVTSAAAGGFSLKMMDESTGKEFLGSCQMDPSFQLVASNFSEVTCEYRDSLTGGRSRPEQIRIGWDRQQVVEREVQKLRDVRTLKVKLLPAKSPGQEEIEVTLEDVDFQKHLEVKGLVASGFEVRHRDAVTGTDLSLRCAPASK